MIPNKPLRIYKLLILLTAGMITLSCGTYYRILDDKPADIEKYLREFREEGSQRGMEIRYPRNMRVRLVDYMSGSRIGHCSRDIPVRIDLDRTFWSNADEIQRRIIFFHELGHCILGRSHLNDSLPNGEWKSLMRGSPLPEGRNFGINLRDYRMEYYLDELFDPKRSAPDWALQENGPTVSYPARQVISFEDGLRSEQWRYSDSTKILPYVDRDRLVVENGENQSSVTLSRRAPIDARQPFRIEATIQTMFKEDSSGVVLFFRNDQRLEYFLLHRSLGMSFGSTNEFRPYAVLPVRGADMNRTLVMGMEQYRDRIYYTLNDEVVYINHASVPDSDSLRFGLSLQPGTVSRVDSMVISGSESD